jgi:hypothetical protein
MVTERAVVEVLSLGVSNQELWGAILSASREMRGSLGAEVSAPTVPRASVNRLGRCSPLRWQSDHALQL